MAAENGFENWNNTEWEASNTGVDGLKHVWHALPQRGTSQVFLVTLNGPGRRYVFIEVFGLKSQNVSARGFVFGLDDGASVELFSDFKKIVEQSGCSDEITYELYRDDKLIECNCTISES